MTEQEQGTVKIVLENFLSKYSNSENKVRYLTRSQLFIAFRAFLCQSGSEYSVLVDFTAFCTHFDHLVNVRKIKTRLLGKSVYYGLNLPKSTIPEPRGLEDPTLQNNAKKINIKIADLNRYVCCKICCGYLVDAVTITECLHSFCRSCIVKHLRMQLHLSCPLCGVAVNSTNPEQSLKSDAALQDIVNKLLPGLQSAKTCKQAELDDAPPALPKPFKTCTICLEWVGAVPGAFSVSEICFKFICVSNQATVAHLCQFVLKELGKLGDDGIPLADCEISCGGAALPAVLTVECLVNYDLVFETVKGVPLLKYNLKPL